MPDDVQCWTLEPFRWCQKVKSTASLWSWRCPTPRPISCLGCSWSGSPATPRRGRGWPPPPTTWVALPWPFVCVCVCVCVNAVFDQTGLKMSLEIRSIDKSDVEMYMKAYQSMARGRPCLFWIANSGYCDASPWPRTSVRGVEPWPGRREVSPLCRQSFSLRGWRILIVRVKLIRDLTGPAGPAPPVPLPWSIYLSLHWILVRGRVPVRIARHVAVGRHVYSFGGPRDVPYRRDGRGARREGDGSRHGVALVRVATLLQ